MRLSLLGGFWANFKNLAFWACFPPLNDQIGKKVPSWEGMVLERKQKQFWNQWGSGKNMAACQNQNSKLHQNKNHPNAIERLLPLHITITWRWCCNKNYKFVIWCNEHLGLVISFFHNNKTRNKQISSSTQLPTYSCYSLLL